MDPSSFNKFKEIASKVTLKVPEGSIFAGVDIAENSALDESTIVYANKNPDGTIEILGVQKL
jgi:glutathione synthase/RimK-type ligase-like ATP-grasp enzyme